MKAINRRLRRLEDQFGPADGKPRFLLVVCEAGRGLALEKDTCIHILDECGRRFVLVNFANVPMGLNAEELQRFLREHGAELSLGSARQDLNESPVRMEWLISGRQPLAASQSVCGSAMKADRTETAERQAHFTQGLENLGSRVNSSSVRLRRNASRSSRFRGVKRKPLIRLSLFGLSWPAPA